jgi:hypothetical protein
MSNINSLLPYPKNINNRNSQYRKRSLYSRIDNSDSSYRSSEKRRKSLVEIQKDEIQRIMRDDPKHYAFLQVFANPNITKKRQTFDLRNKLKFKIVEEKIFDEIKNLMIDLFKKDVKKLRKISYEDITEISLLKDELFGEVRQAEMSQQTHASLFAKFKEFVKRKFTKTTQPQLAQPQLEQSIEGESKLLIDIFFKIITAVQNLGKEKTEENIAVVINKFFNVSIKQIFGEFPEFTRVKPLMNLIQEVKQGPKGPEKMIYRFNLLSLAVFLGIEPLVVLFLFLGGDPSLTNQLNQDASYHLLFFQMTFRNIAMNVGWKPSDKDESKAEYKTYDPQFQSRTAYFEKLMKNIQSTQQLQGISPENQKILGEFMSYLRNQAQPQVQQLQVQQQQQKEITQNSIQQIKQELEDLKKLIILQSQQKEKKQFNEFKQQQSQGRTPPQQPQNYYNFDKYLFNNNKLRRMLTLLSIFGKGIDLSKLVPQAEMARLYVVGNAQYYPEIAKSSVLINMAKDKYLNEKVIIGIDSKYVKYSVYDLLRYFLIFNGFDSANLNNKKKNTGYINNSPNVEINGFNEQLTRLSRIQQTSLSNDPVLPNTPVLTSMPFNFISNINQTSDPFDYSFFFYLIANKGISTNHKLELGCIALLQGSDPNIMPNFAQNLLSQINPNLRLCDIFKMFLAGDYERIIRIFKMYSDEFKKGIWDDKLGEFMKIMINQQEIIKYLQREQLSSQISRDLRRNWNYNNSSQYQENNSMFNRSPTIPQQEKSWFSKIRDRFPNPFRKQQQQEVLPQGPMITTQPYVPSYSISDLSRYQPQQQSVMSGGSKIKLRTFHFLEPKSYNEHAFRAEKPIIAGKMAYDFLRMHYKLKKSSSIMFTIEDRQKDRKYNYIGEKVNNKIIIKST